MKGWGTFLYPITTHNIVCPYWNQGQQVTAGFRALLEGQECGLISNRRIFQNIRRIFPQQKSLLSWTPLTHILWQMGYKVSLFCWREQERLVPSQRGDSSNILDPCHNFNRFWTKKERVRPEALPFSLIWKQFFLTDGNEIYFSLEYRVFFNKSAQHDGTLLLKC